MTGVTGIITDVIDCPQCGLPAQKDDYYVTGEEKVVCNYCGYSHLKTLNASEFSKGFGSIHFAPKSKNGSNSSLRIIKLKYPVINTTQRHNIIMNIQNNFDIHKSSFYVWDEDENKLECLLGKIPKTIEEEYDERKKEIDYYREVAFGSLFSSKDEELEEF